MGTFSVVHWLVALVIAVLLFGPKAISNFAKGAGQSIRSFKRGLTDDLPDELRPRTAATSKGSFLGTGAGSAAQPVNLPRSAKRRRPKNSSANAND